MLYAIVNVAGLNEGVLEMDARAAGAHPLRPGHRLQSITVAEHHALKFLGHGARYAPEVGWHLLPEEHVRKWTRARGADWGLVLEEHKRHLEMRANLRAANMLTCLAEAPLTLTPPPDPPPCVRRYPVPAFEILPDLWLREMTEEESLGFADRLVASGVYQESEDDTRARAATWFDDPLCWPLIVSWRGRTLAYESYHFDPKQPTTVRVGFNTRLQRDRTYRFWREVFMPLFRHFLAMGITTIESRAVNIPEYIDGLIAAYGARRRNGDERWANLEYDLKNTVAMSEGFPQPITAPPGWIFGAGPGLVVREATVEELATLPATVEALWRGLPGSELAVRILGDWTALDAATMLVGVRQDVIHHVTIIRERRPGVSSVAPLTPLMPESEALAVVPGLIAWHRAVRYQALTAFVTDAQLNNDRMQAYLAAWGTTPLRTRQGLTEVERVL